VSHKEYMREWRAKNRDKVENYIKKKNNHTYDNANEPGMKRETAAQAAMWARLLGNASANQAGK
jgi:hypothetical protein